MNRIEIFVRQAAELDAIGYCDYIREYNPDSADQFLAAVDDTVKGLAEQPYKGRLRRFKGEDLQNVRSWRVENFENYLIFYAFDGVRLEILRIKHGAMKFPKALRQ